MFGSAVGVFKNQIVNIILNQFFNPVVNAARGIAAQVNSAVNSFAQNFSTAVRPQIIKNYASGEKEKMLQLMYRSCKATFLLMFVFALPLILEMPYVLKLWLKNVPEYAVLFTILALLDALIDTISYPIVIYGDIDGTGTINANDMGIVYRYISSTSSITFDDIAKTAADLDRSGTVNANDLRNIYTIIKSATHYSGDANVTKIHKDADNYIILNSSIK